MVGKDFTRDVKSIIQEGIEMKKILLESDVGIIISDIVDIIIESFINGRKVILCGNGGSAADAQHIAGEFVGRFAFNRKGLPAIALSTNTSVVTAIGNDFGYEEVFRRQLEANMMVGDVVIGISTSGNSPNIVKALQYAKENGGRTIAFTGSKQCKLDDIAEIIVKIPSDSTPRIQEGHIMIGHIICFLVEREMFA